jgi:hypothetical protein
MPASSTDTDRFISALKASERTNAFIEETTSLIAAAGGLFVLAHLGDNGLDKCAILHFPPLDSNGYTLHRGNRTCNWFAGSLSLDSFDSLSDTVVDGEPLMTPASGDRTSFVAEYLGISREEALALRARARRWTVLFIEPYMQMLVLSKALLKYPEFKFIAVDVPESLSSSSSPVAQSSVDVFI